MRGRTPRGYYLGLSAAAVELNELTETTGMQQGVYADTPARCPWHAATLSVHWTYRPGYSPSCLKRADGRRETHCEGKGNTSASTKRIELAGNRGKGYFTSQGLS
jgi:hypothetical protein